MFYCDDFVKLSTCQVIFFNKKKSRVDSSSVITQLFTSHKDAWIDA